MVSAESGVDQITAALEAGVNEYVMKPFTKDILVGEAPTGGDSSLRARQTWLQ